MQTTQTNYCNLRTTHIILYMAASTIRKNIWLINLIERKGSISLADIQKAWERDSQVNPDEKALPRRTFDRWRREIYDDFGVKIECNRSINEYYIEHINEWRKGDVRSWLLDAMAAGMLLEERDALEGRILLEQIPSGQQHLQPIVEAMKVGKKVELTYQDFCDAEPRSVVVAPYFVKLFERRWNVVGNVGQQDEQKDELERFSLDRVQGVNVLDEDFTMPERFDAAAYYSDCYGVTHYDVFGDTPKATRIVLRISAIQSDYIRTLKIHHSQREIATTNDYSDFELYLRPTYDFMQFVLTLHEHAEVLAPADLRKKLGALVCGMANKYIDSLKEADL